jgi:putative aldouronate transport system substrate-binding protein
MKQRMPMKGLIAAVLCMILLLSACSNGSNSNSKTDNSSSNQASNTPAAKEEKDPFAEKMTISMFNAGTWASAALPTRDVDVQRQMLETAVNIDLQMTIPQIGEADAKLNTMLASGDIPDVMFFNDRAQAVKFYEDGLLTDLNGYLDEFPALQNRFTEDQWAALNHKGQTIGTPGLELVSGINGWWIRNDWLKNVGLAVPTTTEELLNVMKAFTFDDPDKDGKADTYGFVAGVPKDGNIANPSIKLGLDAVMWLFGVNPHKIDIIDGQLVNHNTDPRMKEAVTFMNRIVADKVIDPDWVTISDASGRTDKVERASVGIVIGDWRMMDNPTKIIEASGENPEWISMAPVKGPDGQQILGELAFQNNLWGVSAKAAQDPEKVKRILALLEYWYSDKEAYPYLAFGTQGVFWDYNDKKEVVRIVTDADTNKQYEWNVHYKLTRGASDPLYYNFVKQDFTSNVHQTNIKYSIPAKPSVYLVQDESDTLYQDRIKYVNEALLRFIYGREPISNWDTYVQTLETTYKLAEYEANVMKQFKDQGLLQ